ncbi:MBL fold metallo-hydrolase [Halalkalibacter okhensis]|uniref:Metallo-beta-lactamase n=1 Tax=Halalkalibacter okhensis TaxID=333138 RepID=A0A0B0I664_9BACI|nr:MBL fold metallo-hydrolase [Halalkalibacter okhensis]KHF37923.1 metallo-beta-lactamase [Halalkalibacter okhensis]
MVMSIEKSLWQITFLPRLFPVNCYFIEEEFELTLIDAGLPYSAKKIKAMAAKIGKPITKIIITHAHDDHVGSLDVLKQSLPDAKVYISKREARLLQGDKTLLPHEPTLPIRGGIPKKIKTIPDILLEDGDRIGSLLAVLTPGHTPGLMSFLDTRNGTLIAGDAFQTRGGIAVAGQLQWRFPFPALATWDPLMALHSAYKVRDLKPSFLAVGHGNMVESPLPHISLAIEKAERKLIYDKKKVI